MATMNQRADALTTPHISVIWYRKGDKACFRPDTVADGIILNSLFGKMHFAEEEYLRVLEEASNVGMSVQTLDPDGLFK